MADAIVRGVAEGSLKGRTAAAVDARRAPHIDARAIDPFSFCVETISEYETWTGSVETCNVAEFSVRSRVDHCAACMRMLQLERCIAMGGARPGHHCARCMVLMRSVHRADTPCKPVCSRFLVQYTISSCDPHSGIP